MNDTTSSRLGSTYEIHIRKVASADAQILRYYLQSVAREIILRARKDKRVITCQRYMAPRKVQVDLVFSPTKKRLSFRNLLVCGELWICPVCASRITEKRAAEMSEAVTRWRKNINNRITLNTYTLSHSHDEPLDVVYGRLRAALSRYKGGRPYRRMQAEYDIKGTIRAIEITHGANGWHPHVHEIAFHKRLTTDQRRRWQAESEELWLTCLQKENGSGLPTIAYTSKEGYATVADYVAKFGRQPTKKGWSIEREVAKAPSKTAMKGGRTSLDLLADAGAGDSRAAMLWLEYVDASFNRRFLRWSTGLPELLGMDITKTDAEIAVAQDDDGVLLGYINPDSWRLLMRLPGDQRLELLHVGRSGNFEALRVWLLSRSIVLTRPENANHGTTEIRTDLT